MEARQLVKIIYNALDDKKGGDITIIDISQVSIIGDYFIIADGSNINQVQALADNVKEELYKAGVVTANEEGYRGGSWILMDYKDVVVHIFSREDRRFYDLERIWRDGRQISISEL